MGSCRIIMIFGTGADAAVLLHAEAAERGDGKPQGEERVSYLRENVVRQINLE